MTERAVNSSHDPDEKEHFRTDKRVNIANMLAAAALTVVILGAILTWTRMIENRVSVLEASAEANNANMQILLTNQQRQLDTIMDRHAQDINMLQSRFDRWEGLLQNIDRKLSEDTR